MSSETKYDEVKPEADQPIPLFPVLSDEVKEESQTRRVLLYLLEGRPLDHRIASYKLGIDRLAARIYDLRRNGHRIDTTILHRGAKHWAAYRLVRE